MPRVTELRVNGRTVKTDVPSDRSLLWVLRDELGLTGTKYGCGEGQCGACTVLVNGVSTRSCLAPVGSVAQKEIQTIEGLANGEKLHPVQEAFLSFGAMQCGYCTCGMIMSAAGLLRKNPNPSRTDIVKAMEGNICRCGTYPRIVEAILKGAEVLRSQPK